MNYPWFTVLGMLFAQSLGITAASGQTLSDLVSTYQTHLTQYPGGAATLQANADWQRSQSETLSQIARLEFSDFIDRDERPTLSSQIIDPLDRAYFDQSLNQVGLEKTKAYLGNSQAASIKDFLTEFATVSAQKTFAFNIVQSSEFLSSEMPAGYVGGMHMVLMRYNTMDRASWITIFMHEVSHFLDLKLDQAVNEGAAFQNAHPDIGPRMIDIGKKADLNQEITPEESALVDTWITLAFERGMMAEIRAWTRTYTLYLDLRSEGLIAPVKWADDILIQKRAEESVKDFCKRYFDALYEHPSTGMWSYSYLKNRVETIRTQRLNAL